MKHIYHRLSLFIVTIMMTLGSAVWAQSPQQALNNPVMPGDTNDDRVVEIDDVNNVINLMLGLDELSDRQWINADCHRDSIIDIADVNGVINVMLGKNLAHFPVWKLVVELRDGSWQAFPLSDKPQLSFEDDELVVKTRSETYYYQRNELYQISYERYHGHVALKGKRKRAAMADNPNQFAIYVYRNDNDFNAHLNLDVKSIQFSPVGMDSIWYDNPLVQEVWTEDTVFRTPLTAIDSITFQAPDPIIKSGIFIITEQYLPYLTTATDSTLTFKSSTPASMRPMMGQVVYSDLTNDWFEMGFAGRVINVTTSGGQMTYNFEAVSPGEVYDRLVTVGKFLLDEEDAARSPRRIADDGVIKSPKLSFEVGYKDWIKVKGSAAMSVDYAFCFGWGATDYVNLTVTKDIEYSISSSLKTDLLGSDYSHDEMLPIPICYVGNKFVSLSISVGLFYKLSGKIELGVKIPYKTKHIESYKWSSDDMFNVYYTERSEGGWNDFDALSDAELSLKVKGGAKVGPIVRYSGIIWKKGFMSLNANMRAGISADASFEFDFLNLTGGNYNYYNLLAKDSKITTGMCVELDVTAEALRMTEKTLCSFGTTLFKRDCYLFPRFTEPELPDLVSLNPLKWEDGLQPLSVHTVPSNNLFLPGKVGIIVYDQSGKHVGTKYYDKWYFGGTEREWTKNWLQYDVTGLTRGATYVIRPVFKLLNLVEIDGAPKTNFTVPLPMSFSTDNVTVNEGAEYSVIINNGWGLYQAKNSNNTVASVEVYDSGDNHYLRLKGLKKGVTTITVTDVRSSETATITVTVTDQPTDLILSSTSLQLGEGESGTVDITAGSGQYTVKSSNTSVATATLQGTQVVVKGIKAGTATITVTDTKSNQTATIAVTVNSMPSIQTFTVNGVSFKMVAVDGGTFMMGASDDDEDATGDYEDEKPQHQVTLSSFSIGQTEVTQALWKAVMNSNPSYWEGDLLPVESMSWDDCQVFINKLNELTGESFRLPTEAEWEYAAKGGQYSKGYKFAGSNDVNSVAWTCENSDFYTHNVATKKPNELGLFDMSGNVWEWCQDWYGYYNSSPSTNPTGPSSGRYRIHRGGSVEYIIKDLRVTMRGDYFDSQYSNHLRGLRLAK